MNVKLEEVNKEMRPVFIASKHIQPKGELLYNYGPNKKEVLLEKFKW